MDQSESFTGSKGDFSFGSSSDNNYLTTPAVPPLALTPSASPTSKEWQRSSLKKSPTTATSPISPTTAATPSSISPRRVTYDVMEKWYFVANDAASPDKNTAAAGAEPKKQQSKTKKKPAIESSDTAFINNNNYRQHQQPQQQQQTVADTARSPSSASSRFNNLLNEPAAMTFGQQAAANNAEISGDVNGDRRFLRLAETMTQPVTPVAEFVQVPSPIAFDDYATSPRLVAGDDDPNKNDPNKPHAFCSSDRASSIGGDTDISAELFAEKSFYYLTRQNPVRRAAVKLITWRWFERLSIFVIIVNCVTLGAVDPCEGDVCVTYRCSILQIVDHCIFAFFATEMLIKMLAMGIIGKNAYLAESWNRLDFFIVIAGAAEYVFVMENINLSAIRTIRVLRPLRAINRIPSLRLLVMLLLDTLPMLGNVLLICFFVFFVFGIAGVQLWAGVLRQRCFFPLMSPLEQNAVSILYSASTAPHTVDTVTTTKTTSTTTASATAPSPSPSTASSSGHAPPAPSYAYPSFMPTYYRPPQRDYVCSPSSGILHCADIPKYEHYDSMCIDLFGNDTKETMECKWWADNYTDCLPLGPNPARGTISFDNIGLAWVAIFQVISLEGWTEVMYLIQDAYSFWVWLYFVTLIVIGAFFAVNLCLVVIATQFSETKRRELAKMKQERRAAGSSMSTLQEAGSIAKMSQRSNSLAGGQSNIYTQLLDLVTHSIRQAVRWGRRKMRSRMAASSSSLGAASHHDNSSSKPGADAAMAARNSQLLIANGGSFYDKPEICSNCRLQQQHHLQLGANSSLGSNNTAGATVNNNNNNNNNNGKPHNQRRSLVTEDEPSSGDAWATPATSPEEEQPNSPDLAKKPLLKHTDSSADNNNRDQSTSSSTDVYVSLCGEDDDKNSRLIQNSPSMTLKRLPSIISASDMQEQPVAMRTSDANYEKRRSTMSNSNRPFYLGEERAISAPVVCPVCLQVQQQIVGNNNNSSSNNVSVNNQPPETNHSKLPPVLQKASEKVFAGIEMSRKRLRDVVEHSSTTWIIMGAIVINALSMGAEHHNQPEVLTLAIESMNLVFTILFVIEMVLKVYVYGFVSYIRDGFNMLDFIIVIISVVELAQGSASGLSVLRTFRLVRIVKLIRFLPALQRQLYVMLKTIDNVATFFLLLSLFLFIFSVLGMSLFGCKFCPASKMRTPPMVNGTGDGVNGTAVQNVTGAAAAGSMPWLTPSQQHALAYQTCPRANFDSLLWSLLTVFQVLTQEAWATVLKDGMHYTSEWAALYFVALVTFGNYVLFNLLVAILVEGFSTDDQEETPSMLTHPTGSTTRLQQSTGNVTAPNNVDGTASPPAITVEDVDDPNAARIAILTGHSDGSNKNAKPDEASIAAGGWTIRSLLCNKKRPGWWADFKSSVKKRLFSHNCFTERRDYALYFMARENPFRRGLLWLVSRPRFDNAVLVIILANCIAIAMERPTIEPASVERRILDAANYFFNIVFIIEALIKILAHGFVIGEHTYLKNGWNVLDFFLITLSSIDMILEASHAKTASTKILEIFRVMRLLRALRPLRVINRAPGLKIVVQTLVLSVKPIGNIVLICLAFFLIFGILGVQLFRGCFYKCVSSGHVPPLSEDPIANHNASWPVTTLLRSMNATTAPSPAQLQLVGGAGAALVAEAMMTVKTKNDCLALGFEWENENYNFDNLGNGLMTLFVFSTFDGWVKITRDGLDCVGVDKQPIHDYNPWRLVYFISFLLIVGFFVLNMFVGVVVNNFQKVRKQIEAEIELKKREIKARKLLERLQNKSDSKKRVLRQHLSMVLQCYRPNAGQLSPSPSVAAGLADESSSANLMTTAAGNNNKKAAKKQDVLGTNDDTYYWKSYPPWRYSFYRFCTHKYFDLVVAGVIGINVLTMAMEFYLMPREFYLSVKGLNYAFTAVFILEACAKLVAFGPRRYFRERWNQLDVAIVVLSLIGIGLEDLPNKIIPINPTIVRVARVFRIARVFKLLKMAKGIRQLLDTVSQALPQVGNLSLLFMLLFFIYASLGVELFGKFDCTYKVCEGLSRHANFHNFGIALLTLFRISTGDNWNGILKDTLRLIHDPESHCAHEPGGCFLVQILSPFYFVSFVLVAQFVLINVVVAVLMRQLEDSHTRNEVDPEKIEAEIDGKVEEIEKMVQEKCPDLVQRLQEQIGTDREDAISLVSAEYILRERPSVDANAGGSTLAAAIANASATIAATAAVGQGSGANSNGAVSPSANEAAGNKTTADERYSSSSASASFRKRARPRFLTTAGEHMGLIAAVAEAARRRDDETTSNLLQPRRRNHSDGCGEDDDVAIDSVMLEQVFKDLGEQLRQGKKQGINVNESHDDIFSSTTAVNNVPNTSNNNSSRASKENSNGRLASAAPVEAANKQGKAKDLARNALLLATATADGELSADETARLVDAFSELDEFRSAVDIFIEMRRKELLSSIGKNRINQNTLNSSHEKAKLHGVAAVASARAADKARHNNQQNSNSNNGNGPVIAQSQSGNDVSQHGTGMRLSHSADMTTGSNSGDSSDGSNGSPPNDEPDASLLRLRTSTV